MSNDFQNRVLPNINKENDDFLPPTQFILLLKTLPETLASVFDPSPLEEENILSYIFIQAIYKNQ